MITILPGNTDKGIKAVADPIRAIASNNSKGKHRQGRSDRDSETNCSAPEYEMPIENCLSCLC
ncbi:hypothetical protein [Leptolyngbya sp. FACHB-711]|uniref:hypothetical protein n=1 Tax=unclassified Leptolyngbya TaxID=2650499 RepID=UPI00168A348E|nr:hypothetical protein [Leptolyngbya sp. FACHB-711]MBD1852410.1 hypothetical protein [Cyanobacteria bacterium FACHB-502]MBD2024274.1 hypothetical protein [Leptolyngbya sp. FACHB-711]